MNCGCKKTFCNKKTCKCKKNDSYCTENCACSDERCQNRQVENERDNAVNNNVLSWNEVIETSMKWLEMLKKEGRIPNQAVPTSIEAITQMQSRILKEMDDLNAQMANLALDKMNGAILDVDDWQKFEKSLIPCQSCQRKFTPERIEKHEKVCGRRTYILPIATE